MLVLSEINFAAVMFVTVVHGGHDCIVVDCHITCEPKRQAHLPYEKTSLSATLTGRKLFTRTPVWKTPLLHPSQPWPPHRITPARSPSHASSQLSNRAIAVTSANTGGSTAVTNANRVAWRASPNQKVANGQPNRSNWYISLQGMRSQETDLWYRTLR
jgi:hypothetical protein